MKSPFAYLATLALVAAAVAFVQPALADEPVEPAPAIDVNGDGIADRAERAHRLGAAAQLTEEQRTELRTQIGELRESGATKEEVRAAVTAYFGEAGIDLEALRAERVAAAEARAAVDIERRQLARF